jgi:ferredoxin-type protein NapG
MAPTFWSGLVGRRKFLKWSHLAVLGVGVAVGVGAAPLLRPRKLRLRPPGALEEGKFLATCIKCGQCLQVCPPQIVWLGDLGEGYGVGTPHIEARTGGCILCPGLPCVLACPTGALEHALTEGKDAEMGWAVLSRPDTCLAMLGKGCRICLEKCPIKEHNPIVFQQHTRPGGGLYHEPVVQNTCVGCGKCEQECPTAPASITIQPRLRPKREAA